ncbi:uncharacterized protein VICG_01599 [Vittaforma corneae ATCC 50505]|uniref:Rho-GAP domain-containing protein n=1 Tax=Vittaforma corneae (strain ATCC 50505) TaxID=993615 RepID=L2GKE7_VITCO|nr:uncharacterized protein VICG_01599 [Vittaforma corneae ATCC 50505]ELA41358.1 hypothetical protein VICG_01599 [Vittaforma corneae ATCC 50505]
MEVLTLKQSLLGWVFRRLSTIRVSEYDMRPSHFRFSEHHLLIPGILHLASELLLGDTLEKTQIFRVNSTRQKIIDLMELLRRISASELSKQQGMTRLRAAFDVIDIAAVYKFLFSTFEDPVIPRQMIDIAIKIEQIQDEDDKMACTKAFIWSLPYTNRKILENCVYVCAKTTSKLKKLDSSKKLSLPGLAVIMMPNLIKPHLNEPNWMGIKHLSNFVCYIFEHFKELIKV